MFNDTLPVYNSKRPPASL